MAINQCIITTLQLLINNVDVETNLNLKMIQFKIMLDFILTNFDSFSNDVSYAIVFYSKICDVEYKHYEDVCYNHVLDIVPILKSKLLNIIIKHLNENYEAVSKLIRKERCRFITDLHNKYREEQLSAKIIKRPTKKQSITNKLANSVKKDIVN
jgi:hypothetical protein